MSIIGRRASSVVLESGELVTVLSEHTQVNRSSVNLVEPGTERVRYRVVDTPLSRERILWCSVTQEGRYPYRPAFVPVFVKRVQGPGAEPNLVHYLRNSIHPELQYNWTTGEVILFWWENRYSPYPEHLKGTYILNVEFKEYLFSIGVSGVDFNSQNIEENKTLLQQAIKDALIAIGFTVPIEVDQISDFKYRIKIASSLLSFQDSLEAQDVLGIELTVSGPETVNLEINDSLEMLNFTLDFKMESFEIQTSELFYDSTRVSESVEFLQQSLKSKLEPLGYTGRAEVLVISPAVFVTEFDIPVKVMAAALWSFPGNIAIEHLNENQNQLTFIKNPDPSLVAPIRDTPIESGLELPRSEPHAELNTIPGYKTHDTGDPNKFAGPAVYNHFIPGFTLGIGGVAEAKNTNPFEESTIARTFPVSPGMLDLDVVQAVGERVSLTAIENELQTHTSHLYHQREVQDLGLGTRVLMYSRGVIEDLDIEEVVPQEGIEAGFEVGGVKIGAGYLLPGKVGEYYRGSVSGLIQDAQIYFGGISLGILNAVFIDLIVGESGQILRASGGTAPYTWNLRPIASTIYGVPTSVEGYSDPYLGPELVFSDPDSITRGGLPEGLFLHRNGFLYGRPTETGVFAFRVQVQDSVGIVTEQSMVLDVSNDGQEWQCKPDINNDMEITNSGDLGRVLPGQESDFWVGLRAKGGQPPYSWTGPSEAISESSMFSKLGGHIPSGMTISATGEITLAPGTVENNPGLWLFQVRARGVDGKCVRKLFTLALGVPVIDGPTPGATDLKYPETMQDKVRRSVLILQPSRIASVYVQGANSIARGPAPNTIGGYELPNVRPGNVQSLMPGVVMSAGPLEVTQQGYSPAKGILDWIPSNPHDLFSASNDVLNNRASPVETTVENPLNKHEVQEFRFSPDVFKDRLVGVYQVSLGGSSYNAISFDSESPESNVAPLRAAILSTMPSYVESIAVTPLNRLVYEVVFRLKTDTKWEAGIYQAQPGSAFNGTVSVFETSRGQNLGDVTLEGATILDIASKGRKLRPLWPV